MVFNPEETADNLRKQGGFIPGVRPGSATVTYIKNVLHRVTLPGGIFIAVIAVVPTIIFYFTGNHAYPGVRRYFHPYHDRRCARYHEQG